MDEMRAMLDELMGKERDVPLPEREKIKSKKRYFDDQDVCKLYLCGFCPYEEFQRTKNDCGECPQIHDDNCRSQWEALDDKEKDRYGYEYDLLRRMDRHMSDLRRRMEKNQERVAANQEGFVADNKAAIEQMTKEIDDLLAEAEKLGEEGDVDAAEEATKKADAIRERKLYFEKQAQSRLSTAASKGLVQSVCPVSGLIINDEESRLRDHHAGRNYNAWKKFHEVYNALKEKLKARDEEKRSRDRGGGHRDRNRSRERDRGGKDRGRSSHHSDKYSSRDRGRDRDYRGDRRRHRRSRSRSRDRRSRRSRSRSPRDRSERERGYEHDNKHRLDEGEIPPSGAAAPPLPPSAAGVPEREESPEEGEARD